MGRRCSELSFLTAGMSLQVLHSSVHSSSSCLCFLGSGEHFPFSRLPQTFARGWDILNILGFVIFDG